MLVEPPIRGPVAGFAITIGVPDGSELILRALNGRETINNPPGLRAAAEARATGAKPPPCWVADRPGCVSQRRSVVSPCPPDPVRARLRLVCILIPLAGLCAYASLFVGTDVVVWRYFPNMPTGVRHALLSGWAIIVTALSGAAIHAVIRRQHERLTATAGQLARLIASYQSNAAAASRFHNPHLVHCRDVKPCECTECPMYDTRGERCWQVLALSRARHDHVAPRIELELCMGCEVFRRSCPDKLTELGESFNNLMFLLETGTERLRRMQSQMIEKEKMVAVGRMAAGVAHEVCNPLSSISSVVQMLKRKPESGSLLADLKLIETHIRRISGTVRQLAGLARPGGEHWELVDVARAVQDTVRLISFDKRARQVEIIVLAPSVPLQTYASRDQLQQVLINLALNALDAMPDGGKLTMGAERRGQTIVVEVSDTGCGIPAAVGRRVFEPFFTTKPPGRGTGLGLAVSYGIVETHGGMIDFRPNNGRGTIFTVELPVVSGPPGST